MTKNNELLTPAEVSQRYKGKIKTTTLAQWRARKPRKGPKPTKIGGRVFYKISDLEDFERPTRK